MIRPVLLLAAISTVSSLAPAQELPREWIDAETHHRVVQLSTESGSQCLYFTQPAFTGGGGRMLITTPHGMALVDLSTRKIEALADTAGGSPVQTGQKTGRIFYTRNGRLLVYDPAEKSSRLLATLPANTVITTINADETLASGCISPPDPDSIKPHYPATKSGAAHAGAPILGQDQYPDKGDYMTRRLALHLPSDVITVDLRSGAAKVVLHTTDWIDHFQFSPTDPTLLMYAHEGSSQKVDRIWLLRLDGRSTPLLVHRRTLTMEGVTHEFWSHDGQWIWYDLRAPRGVVFWVAGYNVRTGERIWYHLDPDESSAHYNVSPDGTLFAGDGSGDADRGIAHPGARKWLYLFHPRVLTDAGTLPDSSPLVQSGVFRSERLVDLSRHDYSLEPNATFTPDGRWIVFRSNMRGACQVYAVEIETTR
ncbi:MAG TPA: oligogalacturonate lyase family protein [Opitutaceae bacterium]|nr:oligogalacturonate lyase family protein [Opitutaceae bacterium]